MTNNGPYHSAHARLEKNAELMRYLRAVQVKTGKSLARVVEDACIEIHAPDLLRKQSTLVSLQRRRTPASVIDELRVRLWGIRAERGIPLGEVIEEACCLWIDRCVHKIDEYGAAVIYDAEVLPNSGGLTYAQLQRQIEATPSNDPIIVQSREFARAYGALRAEFGEAAFARFAADHARATPPTDPRDPYPGTAAWVEQYAAWLREERELGRKIDAAIAHRVDFDDPFAGVIT